MRYPIAIEPGTATTGFGVVVPDLPGCFSAGDTLGEAMQGTPPRRGSMRNSVRGDRCPRRPAWSRCGAGRDTAAGRSGASPCPIAHPGRAYRPNSRAIPSIPSSVSGNIRPVISRRIIAIDVPAPQAISGSGFSQAAWRKWSHRRASQTEPASSL